MTQDLHYYVPHPCPWPEEGLKFSVMSCKHKSLATHPLHALCVTGNMQGAHCYMTCTSIQHQGLRARSVHVRH